LILSPNEGFETTSIFIFCIGACAGENNALSERPSDDGLTRIVNPFKSTCYDWRDNRIPCDFKRQYAELLIDRPIPASRFIDNKDGTVTDNLTMLIWLKIPTALESWIGGVLPWR
jgi:hypothetical protein